MNLFIRVRCAEPLVFLIIAEVNFFVVQLDLKIMLVEERKIWESIVGNVNVKEM